MNNTEIHKELKSYFQKQKISQQDIAKDMGVPQSYINAILNGKKFLGKKNAQKMADLFGLSATWLLTGEGQMTIRRINNIDVNLGDNIGGVQVLGHGKVENPIINNADANELARLRQENKELRADKESLQRQLDFVMSIIKKEENEK